MDKARLDQILGDALKSPPFTIAAASLSSTSVTTLFTNFLGDSLVLKGARQLSTDATETVIAGTFTQQLFGQSGLNAEAHFSVVDQIAQVRIILSGLPANWSPGSSWPALAAGLSAELAYSNVQLILGSQDQNGLAPGFQIAYGLPVNTPALEARVVRGLSLSATATVDPDHLLGQLLGGSSFAVSAPIELIGQVPRLVLTATGVKAFAIGSFSLPIQLQYVLSFLDPAVADDPPNLTAVTYLQASIEKELSGKTVSIPFTARYFGSKPDLIFLASDLSSLSDLAFAEISSLIEGASLDGQVPGEFPALSAIQLQGIQLTVSVGTGSLALLNIAATVGFKDPKTGWAPFGKLVNVHDMAVTFSFAPHSKKVQTFIAAKADIAGGTLDASISLPDMSFEVVLESGTSLDVREIVNEIVGGSLKMPAINCTTFRVLGDVTDQSYRFQAVVDSTWSINIGSKPLVLESIGFDLTHDQTGGSTTGQMIGQFSIAGTQLQVCADYNGPTLGWTFTGGTPSDQQINLTALIADVADLFGMTLPSSVPAIEIINIDMTYTTGTGHFSFACGTAMTLADQSVQLGVYVSNVDDAGNPGAEFKGYLAIGTAQFEIDLNSSSADKSISATWADSANPLSFSAVADYFHLDLSEVPPELIPDLVEAGFTYDFTTGLLALSAMTEHAKLVFVTLKRSSDQRRVYAALLGISVSATLSNLPVIGQKLGAQANMGVDGLQLAVLSDALTQAEVALLNQAIPKGMQGLPTFPNQALDAGVTLGVPLQLGGNPQPPVAVQYTGGSNQTPAPMAGSGPTSPAAPKAAWVNVQRSFGPVNIERVGISYHDSKVWLLLDAGFVLSGLTLDLLGLSLGFTLKDPPTITPALAGIGLSFAGGPVDISGGLLRFVNPDGSVEYDGEVRVEAESFGLSAIASYLTASDGPSLFVFAMLDAPLGGPAFLFVTGVAAGFGYNRNLVLPTLDNLPTFPLVAAAMAGAGPNPFAGKANDPAAALGVMRQYIPVTYGQNWLAVGLRFTSFELLQSFALATVTFGTRFEVALLGLSALTVPTGAENPIGFAELALMATFAPDSGLLAIGAKLTSASYILDKAAHLTGGFAFYLWLKDQANGAAAGEFVVTLGGYHPAFAAPAFFPTEPRVGLNWQVTPSLMVKGGLYFALVPSAVMAGGSLEATWQSGDLKAWFTADADFILGWKPFFYQADMGLSIGASYKANLGVTSHTYTVHVGVNVSLWGPKFAGQAKVDLHVVSFTIHFGDSNPSAQPIQWSEFKSSFLPKVQSGPAQAHVHPLVAMAAADSPIPTDTYCYTRVAGGLLKDLSQQKQSPSDPDWVLNSEGLSLVTYTAIPATKASLITGDGKGGSKTVPLTGPWNAGGFGVGPVGIANGELLSHHQITLVKLSDGRPDYTYDVTLETTVEPLVGALPAATWTTAAALSPSLHALNTSPRTVDQVLTGFSLVPKPVEPDATPPYDLAELQSTPSSPRPFAWAVPQIPTTDSFDQTTALTQLTASINDPTISQKRSALLQALGAQNVAVPTTVNLSRMAAAGADVLLSPPVLSFLGEEPA